MTAERAKQHNLWAFYGATTGSVSDVVGAEATDGLIWWWLSHGGRFGVLVAAFDNVAPAVAVTVIGRRSPLCVSMRPRLRLERWSRFRLGDQLEELPAVGSRRWGDPDCTSVDVRRLYYDRAAPSGGK
jgi:hypothetical protein